MRRDWSKRYKHVHGLSEDGKGPPENLDGLVSLSGAYTWLTEEGPVVIDVEGDRVLITESLDERTTELLKQELFATYVAEGK